MMRTLRTSWILLAVSVSGFSTETLAQEMRVYTTVRNLAAQGVGEPGDRAPVVARSLTLFHAGKIYDYVDAAREVTIYEPAHRRFTLLNEGRAAKAEVAQDEVRQYLSLAEQEIWKRLDSANEQSSSTLVKSLGWLKFQLEPEFTSTFDKGKSALSLRGASCRYEVECVAASSPTVAESYLRFADAMAELNSVLHPRALLPAPRLKLNEELRQRELLPVIVELRADLDRPLWLQARHEWTWKFSSTDRELISKWERQLEETSVRKLPFRQYQHESLSGENVARRR